MHSCFLWNLLLLALIVFVGTLRIFSRKSISFYKNRTPKFNVRTFFDGNVEGWGAIFDHSGTQVRSFSLRLKGTWQNEKEGTLEEWFDFNDGKQLTRKWNIAVTDDGYLVGTADDVVKKAQGIQMGNALNTHYILRVPHKKDRTIDITMDDWIYEVSPGVVLNRARMKKFGFPVGELVLMMKKL